MAAWTEDSRWGKGPPICFSCCSRSAEIRHFRRGGGAAGQCWARGGLCMALPFTAAVLPAEKGFTSYVCGNQPSKTPKLPADTTITHNTQKRMRRAEASACAHPSTPLETPKLSPITPQGLGSRGCLEVLARPSPAKVFIEAAALEA